MAGGSGLSDEQRTALIAAHGYVPGDRFSMAEGVVARVERELGIEMEALPERPSDGRRAWKFSGDDWEVGIECAGFDIFIWSEDHRTDEKTSLSEVADQADFARLSAFMAEAIEKAREQGPHPGPF